MVALVAAVLAMAGAWYWHEGGKRQETDNAYVNARIVQVSSLVMGQVTAVPIQENEYVHKADVLFEVDRRPFEAALAESEGKLRQAEQGNRQDSPRPGRRRTSPTPRRTCGARTSSSGRTSCRSRRPTTRRRV
jgi:multidrug resistance efflux pump